VSDDTTTTDPTPPDVDTGGDEDDGNSWSCIEVSVIRPDGNRHETTAYLYDADARDPERFAAELLNTALAAAQMRGSDYAWAVMRHFSAYRGGPV
jgi:hypothetical protein